MPCSKPNHRGVVSHSTSDCRGLTDAEVQEVFGAGEIRDELAIASNLKAIRDRKAREAEAARRDAQPGARRKAPAAPTDPLLVEGQVDEASDEEDGGPPRLDNSGSGSQPLDPVLVYQGATPTLEELAQSFQMMVGKSAQTESLLQQMSQDLDRTHTELIGNKSDISLLAGQQDKVSKKIDRLAEAFGEKLQEQEARTDSITSSLASINEVLRTLTARLGRSDEEDREPPGQGQRRHRQRANRTGGHRRLRSPQRDAHESEEEVPAGDQGLITLDKIAKVFTEKFREMQGLPDVDRTYVNPLTPEVNATPFPLGYKQIRFTPFTGQASEDAEAHIMRFTNEAGQYASDPVMKLKQFPTSLAGEAAKWYLKLKPGSIGDWKTMEVLFRTMFGVVEPRIRLKDLSEIEQESGESALDYLKRFKLNLARCDMDIPEERAVELAIDGLEDDIRQGFRQVHVVTMADLTNRLAIEMNYVTRQREKKEKKKGVPASYYPGSLKLKQPLPVPSKTVAFVQTDAELDPTFTWADADDLEREVAMLERTGLGPLHSKVATGVKEPVKIMTPLPTKSAFESYTYNAHKAPQILQELFDLGRLRHDNGLVPKAGYMAGKTYCAFHNMNNHNTKDCVKLKDQLQTWVNDGILKIEAPPQPTWQAPKGPNAVNAIELVPGPDPGALPTYQTSRFSGYTYDTNRVSEIWAALDRQGTPELRPPGGWSVGGFACVYHRSNSHSGALCVGAMDQIQEWLNDGKLEIVTQPGPVLEAWVNAIEGGEAGYDSKVASSCHPPEEGIVQVPVSKLCLDCRIECGLPISKEEYYASIKEAERRAFQKALEEAEKARSARSLPEGSAHKGHKRARHSHDQEDSYPGRTRGRLASESEDARARSAGGSSRTRDPGPSRSRGPESRSSDKEASAGVYIPPASRNELKPDTWYKQSQGKPVELFSVTTRNQRRQYGKAQRTLNAIASGKVTEGDLRVPLDHVLDTLKKNDARPRKEPRSFIKGQTIPHPRRNVHDRLADPPRATGAPQHGPRCKVDLSPGKARAQALSPDSGRRISSQRRSESDPQEDTMVIDARPDSTIMRWVPKKPVSQVDVGEGRSADAQPARADLARSSSLTKAPTLPEYTALMLKVAPPQRSESKPSSIRAGSEVGNEDVDHEGDQLLDYEGEDEVMGDEDAAYECNTVVLDPPSFECHMAFLLSAEYALPEPVPTSEFIPAEGHDQQVCIIQEPQEEVVADANPGMSQSNHKYPEGAGEVFKQCVMFAKPTYGMSQHIKPLYVTAEVAGVRIHKILIDTGAAVSIITTAALEHLQIPKEKILSTVAKVKGFAGNVTPTTGIVMLKVKLGPSDAIQGLFVTEMSTPYSMILGRDWIHRTWSVPSSLHQELMMWDQEADVPVLVKADDHPFSIAACQLEAGYYTRDIRPLQVSAVDQDGRPIGVASSALTQWGISQATTDYSRPFTIVLPQALSNE